MKENNRQRIAYLMAVVAVCAAVMSVVDAVIQPPYFLKSAIKLVLFLLLPAGYFGLWREERGHLPTLLRPKWRALAWQVLPGVAVYALIVGGYFLLSRFMDFSGVADKLTADAGVSADNFLYVSLYISLVNSCLEELLFRGFGFLTLKRLTSRPLAHVFSAALFALYHAGMTAGYFSAGVFAVTLLGLFGAGLLFNFLDERSGTIYPSWFVHMFANFGINTVGFILFGML